MRKPSDDKCTEGELLWNGEHQCFTLEDVVRYAKISGCTAIPAGTYQVTLTFSPKFNRVMPLINDVPNYEGVRIHYGNTAEDTEGCLLVGTTLGADFIGHSRDAFATLFDKLSNAINGGDTVQITYVNA
jgi:hypothetical protein